MSLAVMFGRTAFTPLATYHFSNLFSMLSVVILSKLASHAPLLVSQATAGLWVRLSSSLLLGTSWSIRLRPLLVRKLLILGILLTPSWPPPSSSKAMGLPLEMPPLNAMPLVSTILAKLVGLRAI